MIRQRLIEEEAERRERMRKRISIDELEGGYFTKKDLLAINKRRSRSFDFKRHKKISKPQTKKLYRNNSWVAHEFYEKMAQE